jgi:membrane protein required for colicin V production
MFGSVDRSLGALFGVVRGALLVCVLFLVVEWLYPVKELRPPWISEARTLPMVSSGAEILKAVIPEEFIKQGADAADSTRATVDQAVELGTAAGVIPGAGGASTATAGPSPESAGSTGDSGYKDAERNDLERLIQGTQ